jgi:hypothetical protein
MIMKNTLLLLLFIIFSLNIAAQVPTISDFNPKSGDAGTTVTITGTNFSTTLASNIVFFGATKATVTAATATQLTVTVPNGATFKPISVLVNGLTGFSARAFQPTFRKNRGILQTTSAFFAASSFSTRKAPNAPSISDLDGDNLSDFVVAGGGPPGVSVYRNLGVETDYPFDGGKEISDVISGSISNLTDLDGDSKKDWILLAGQTLYVLRNTSTIGNITFASPLTFTLSSAATKMEVWDIDKDGKADILVNTTGNALTLLRNTGSAGNITLAAVTINTSAVFKSIKVEDMDNDQKPDIIGCTDTKIQILKNAYPTFTELNAVTSSETITDVAVGDIDGDNISDLVYPTQSSKINYLHHVSTATTIAFDNAITFRIEFQPDLIALADLNGDGKLDIISSRSFASGVSPGIGILMNLTNSSTVGFESTIYYSFGSGGDAITEILIGDFNNDNKSDVMTRLYGSFPSLAILYNRVPTSPQIYDISPTTGNVGSKITITGINFNSITTGNAVQLGAVKAVVQSSNGNQLTAKIPAGVTHQAISLTTDAGVDYISKPLWVTFPTTSNLTRATFLAETGILNAATSSGTEEVFPADLDNDGKPEIVASTSAGISIVKNNTVTNSRTLSFVAVSGLPASYIVKAVADINYDGKLDITTFNSSTQAINILLNTTTTSITFAAPVALANPPGGSNLTVGDMDGDGKADIVANSARVDGEVLVYRNIGKGNTISFASPVHFSVGSATMDVFVYDLNNDGKLDIVTEKLTALQNQSTVGNLAFSSVLSLNNGLFFEQNIYSGIIAADLNADGKPELITGNGLVLPNTSTTTTISFGSSIVLSSVDVNSFYVNVADFDGDGKPDLVFNDPTRTTPGNGTLDNAVSIFRNLSQTGGSLNFDTKFRFVVSGSLRTIADVNGDGKTDIIFRNSTDIYVSLNAILPPAPTLTTFSPLTGSGPGRTVYLSGTNFVEIQSISFGGTVQPIYTVNEDFTQISLVVPDGATSGDLIITTAGGSASIPFTAIDPASFITGSSVICPAQKNIVYSVNTVSGASGYEWTLPTGMTIIKGNNTNTITVNLDNPFTGVGTIRVRGIFGTFKGENSPTFNVSVATIPTVPANLQAKIAASGTVALTWEDKSSDETEFFIYRATNIDTAFVLLGKAGSNLTGFTDNFDLKPATVYFYRIAATNGDCQSAFTNVAGVTIPAAVITSVSAFSEKNITVSPNPSDGVFEVTFDKSFKGVIKIYILDALGKIVWQEQGTVAEKNTIDLTQRTKGAYFLKIQLSEGVIIKKIIKND